LLILTSSGDVTFSGTLEKSGLLTIKPGAYFQTGAVPASGLITGIDAFPSVTSSGVNSAEAHAGDQQILLTLTNGVFRAASDINSGMFSFGATMPAENITAIKSGIEALTFERLSDTKLLITAASGLLVHTDTSISSGGIALSSGAFLLNSGLTPSITAKYMINPLVTLSGVYSATTSATNSGVTLTLVKGVWRTAAEGFDPSAIVFKGSGATAVELAKNNSVASVLNAALQNGDYQRTGDTTLVITFDPAGQAIAFNQNLLRVEIRSDALSEYASDGTNTTVSIARLS
jgi:hypothetical protein